MYKHCVGTRKKGGPAKGKIARGRKGGKHVTPSASTMGRERSHNVDVERENLRNGREPDSCAKKSSKRKKSARCLVRNTPMRKCRSNPHIISTSTKPREKAQCNHKLQPKLVVQGWLGCICKIHRRQKRAGRQALGAKEVRQHGPYCNLQGIYHIQYTWSC